MKEIEKVLTYREIAYKNIKHGIIFGSFLPGQLLNERKMAVYLNVSRTPIREAFQMLESEGWVTIEPWKGIRVKSVSVKEIKDIFKMRTILECNNVGEIACKVTKDDIRQFELLQSQMRNFRYPSQISEFAEVDHSFHKRLALMSGNDLLIRWIEELNDMVKRITVHLLNNKGNRFRECVAEHDAVIAELSRHNKKKASDMMKRHLCQGEENFVELLSMGA